MQIQINKQNNNDVIRGLIEVQKQCYSDAFSFFKTAISYHPSELAKILIPLYQELMKSQDNINLRFLISHLYIQACYYKEAISELEDIFQLNSKHPDIYLFLGKIYKKSQNSSLVLPLLKEAFKRKIYDSSLIDLLPKIYLETKQLTDAILFYEELIATNKRDSQFYKVLAELYLQNAEFGKAISIYDLLIESAPDMSEHILKKLELILRTQQDNLNLRELVIKLNFRTCNPAKATEHIKDIYRYKPNYLSNAIQTLTDALKTFPEESNILQVLSYLLIERSNYSDAITLLKTLYKNDKNKVKVIHNYLHTILRNYPKQVYALQLKFQLEIDEKQFESALSTLENLLNLDTSEDHYTFCHDALSKLKNNAPETHKNSLTFLECRLLLIEDKYQETRTLLSTLKNTDYELKAILLQVKICEEDKNATERLQLLKGALQKFPNAKELHQALISTLDSNIEMMLDDTSNEVTKGLLYLREGKLLNALEYFQRITEDNPNHIYIQTLIGRCFLEMGKTDIALEQFTRTLNQLTSHSDPLVNKTLYYQAITYFHLGKIEIGIQKLKEIERNNINFPKLQNLLNFYKNCNVLESRYKSSVLIFPFLSLETPYFTSIELSGNETADQTMSFALEHNNKGVDQLLKQNIKSACTSLQLAIQIEENCVPALCNLALTYILSGDFKKAFTYLEQSESINSSFALTYLCRGIIYFRLNNYNLALTQFKKALFYQAQIEIAYIYIGDTYYKLNQIKQAFEFWNKAQQIGAYTHLVFRRVHYALIQSLTINDWLGPFEFHHSDLPKSLSQVNND